MTPDRSHRIVDLRIEHLWQVAAIAAPFTVGAGTATFTGDTWWALRMGQLSVQAGHPVLDSVLAHTPTIGVILNGQWLGQALLYVLYVLAGDIGIRLVCGGLTALTFGILLRVSQASGSSRRSAAMAVLLATLLASSNVTLRAQLFAYPLFALTYALFCSRPLHPRLLWILAPVFALWANIHGSFVLGLVLVAILVAAEVLDTARRAGRDVGRVMVSAAWIVAGCVLATLVNPLGVRIYEYVYSLMGHPVVAWVEEWRAPVVASPMGLSLVFSCLLVAACFWKAPIPIRVREGLLVLVFGYLAWSSVRHVVWWGIVITPIVAVRLDSLSRRQAAAPSPELERTAPTRGRAIANLVLAGVIVGVAATSAVWRPALAARVEGPKVTAEYSPIRASEYVDSLPAGRRLFHYQPWTGYIDWRLWPRHQPFLDGRIEVHTLQVWDDYLDVNAVKPDWQQRLDRYGVDLLMLHKGEQRRLIDAALASDRWAQTYEDDISVVLLRQDPPPAASGGPAASAGSGAK